MKAVITIYLSVIWASATIPALSQPHDKSNQLDVSTRNKQVKVAEALAQTSIEQLPDQNGEYIIPIFQSCNSLLTDRQIHAVQMSVKGLAPKLRRVIARRGFILVIVHASKSESLKTETRWYRKDDCVTGAYTRDTKTIFVRFDDNGTYHTEESFDTQEVVVHQIGHVIDELLENASQSDEFIAAVYEDWKTTMGTNCPSKFPSGNLRESFADAFLGLERNKTRLLTSEGVNQLLRLHQKESEIIKRKLETVLEVQFD